VEAMVRELANSLPKEARRLFLDSDLNYLGSNVLVLVNGKEISALKGLETEINEDDEVMVIPVSHGG